MDGIGDEFHRQTKYVSGRMPAGGLRWEDQPALYKVYPDAVKVELPKFEQVRAMNLDEALRMRKSVRDYADKPLCAEQLSYLLWASTGIQRLEGGYAFRTAPSAGALYPIETYLVVNNVRKVDSGVYHYCVREHQLERLKTGDFSTDIAHAALGQAMCAASAVVFVWTALFERCKWKYGQRAYRYIYLDTGHIAENLALAATSLKLGSCEIGALFDDKVNLLMGVDYEQESVVCMAAVGVPGST